MSKQDWKAALTKTLVRGNLSKIARELRTLTYEELHDQDVVFEIAFERACDAVSEPCLLHDYYLSIYQDYINTTVKFEDRLRDKFCYKEGYSIGLSDEVIRAAIRMMTKFAESTESEMVSRDWLIRQAEYEAMFCNMNPYLEELTRFLRSWQKALTHNIQAMRRLDNERTKSRG